MEDVSDRAGAAVASSSKPFVVIAEEMEMTTTQLREVLEGKRSLSSLQLALLAESTGVSVWYLLTGATHEPTVSFEHTGWVVKVFTSEMLFPVIREFSSKKAAKEFYDSVSPGRHGTVELFKRRVEQETMDRKDG